MKTVILLRAASGAGKSTFANILTTKIGWVCVCADDYFTNLYGNYNFDASKLGAAHNECQRKFMEAIYDPNVEGIVVANTNTRECDFSFYERAAKEADAQVFSLIVENRHGNIDVHGVPDETKKRQAANIMNSIRLI